MSNRSAAAGWNTRFSDVRFQGYDGDHGANIFPYQNQEIRAVPGANGNYDGAVTFPALSTSICVIFDVETPFSAGTTVTVGTPADADLFVTLADAVDLTTAGIKTITREVAFPVDSVFRVVIGGGPVAGACDVTVQVQQ